MVSEKQRLQRAMRLEEADRPPCICPGGMMNMVTGSPLPNVQAILKTVKSWQSKNPEAVRHRL